MRNKIQFVIFAENLDGLQHGVIVEVKCVLIKIPWHLR